MAKADMDSMPTGKRQAAAPLEATDSDNLWGESVNDVENREAARAANVRDASFINYDVALDAYAARGDVEDLAHKNARNMPTDFADAAFMREADGNGGFGSGGSSNG